MSQHDYDLANASGAAFRADLNSALAAIVTWNSGASDPSTTFARMRAVNTTSGVVKRRNAANSGWIVESTDDESFVLSRSSNTLLDVSDIGKTIVATATFTQTLDAAATLTGSWSVNYRVEAGCTVTLDPNGSENIDGATTKVLLGPTSGTIFCNGSAFFTVGFPAPIITRRKTADESVTSSTTLQDDDHLAFPIAVNEEWVARIAVDLGAGLNVTGAKIAINAPAGATINVAAFMGAAAANAEYKRTTTIAAALAWTVGDFSGGTNDSMLIVELWVLNGANAGNITLQWAQNTSSATALTFRKGSMLEAKRLA